MARRSRRRRWRHGRNPRRVKRLLVKDPPWMLAGLSRGPCGRASLAGMTLRLADLNCMDLAAFEASIGETFELAPWVAPQAHARRPFADGVRSACSHDGGGAGIIPRTPARHSCAIIPILPARRRRDHRQFEERAGERGARHPLRGGVRPLPSPERRLQGEVRLPLHGVRAPRYARLRSWRSSSATCGMTKRRSSLLRFQEVSTSRGCASRRR